MLSTQDQEDKDTDLKNDSLKFLALRFHSEKSKIGFNNKPKK